MSSARFPDGDIFPVEESTAKHAQVDDIIAIEVEGELINVELGLTATRIGVVSRRVWFTDGTIRLDMTDYPAPIT